MSADDILDLIRYDTKSSIDSTATAPNLPGAGRTVGLLFDWLGARLEKALNSRASKLGYDPDVVSQNIRQLCGHDKRSIVERHKCSEIQLSRAEKRNLNKLCKKLILCASSRVLSTQLKALEEITSLSVEDPLIRSILVGCNLRALVPKYKEPDLIVSTIKTFGSMEHAQVHELWSGVISHMQHETPLEFCPLSDPDALIRSLSDPQSSFLAARYLVRVIRQLAVEKSHWISYTYTPPTRIEEISFHYLGVVGQSPNLAEWASLNDYISNIDTSALINDIDVQDSIKRPNGKLRRQVLELSRTFIEYPQQMQSVAETFFMAPLIEYNTVDGLIAITKVSDWILDTRRCHRLCSAFLTELSGSEDPQVQLSFIRDGIDKSSRRKLKSTVFSSEAYIAYCRMASIIYEDSEVNVLGHLGFQSLDCRELLFWTEVLFSSFVSAESINEKAISACLIGRFIATDRYAKAIMLYAFKSAPWTHCTLSPHVSRNLKDLHKIYGHYKAPYLLRFRINDKIYIISDSFRLYSDVSWLLKKMWHTKHPFAVDVMFTGRETAIWCPVPREKAFNVTGHYPILAGFGPQGKALYVAGDGFGNGVLTCVADGDSTVEMRKPFEEEFQVTDQFKVLVLQHDPSDMHPPYPSSPKGAMHPTGPLHWLAYWPQKDPLAELPHEEHEETEEYEEYDEYDDHDLSLILNVLHFAILADSKTERKYKFWVHFRDAVHQAKPEITGWEEESLRELLNKLLIRESDEGPESELAGDSCSSDSEEDAAQVSQPPVIKDSDANSSLAPPAYCLEPGEASTPTDGEQGVEEGGSEIQKLREKLQRTQGLVAEQQRELRRMQELMTEMQSERMIGKGVDG